MFKFVAGLCLIIATFATAIEARDFFHNWKGKRNFKMELIEVQQTKMLESFI